MPDALLKIPSYGTFLGFWITFGRWRDPRQWHGKQHRLWSIGWLRCWYTAPYRSPR